MSCVDGNAGAGLDARAAAIVMRSVRNIVSTGRTIVCKRPQLAPARPCECECVRGLSSSTSKSMTRAATQCFTHVGSIVLADSRSNTSFYMLSPSMKFVQ
jgi:hypothetical protein